MSAAAVASPALVPPPSLPHVPVAAAAAAPGGPPLDVTVESTWEAFKKNALVVKIQEVGEKVKECALWIHGMMGPVFDILLGIAFFIINPTFFFVGFIIGMVCSKHVNEAIDKIKKIWSAQPFIGAACIVAACFFALPATLMVSTILFSASLGRRGHDVAFPPEEGEAAVKEGDQSGPIGPIVKARVDELEVKIALEAPSAAVATGRGIAAVAAAAARAVVKKQT